MVKIGDVFGELTVIARCEVKNNQRMFECKCSCGKMHKVSGSRLTSGDTRSCGCLRKRLAKENATSHGMCGTKFYSVYASIIQRCNNIKNKSYPRYGGRGIKCLWGSFEDFMDDMYESYLQHCDEFGNRNTTLDRIDNDFSYCKENCRWATYAEQNRNKSSNIILDGKIMKDYAKEHNINYSTIQSRIYRKKKKGG